MKPTFFATPAQFRAWLARNHAKSSVLLVGLRKRASGRPSLTWPEAVDEALCFGWIDGVRRTLDETTYTVRFTPRKPGSTWSAKNIRRAAELEAEGRMEPAGRAALARRSEAKSRTYSYERRAPASLADALQKRFKANAAAWTFFQTLAPSYRRKVLHWVTSAKQEETRRERLERAVAAFAAGRKL